MRILGLIVAAMFIGVMAAAAAPIYSNSLGTVENIHVLNRTTTSAGSINGVLDGKQLGWSNFDGAAHWRVKVRHHRNLNLEFDSGLFGVKDEDSEHDSTIIKGSEIELIEDRAYVFRVEAYNSSQQLIARGAVKHTHDIIPNNGSISFTEAHDGDYQPGDLTVDWNTPTLYNATLDNYYIRWWEKGQSWNNSDKATTSSSIYTITGLESGKEYVVRVELVLASYNENVRWATGRHTME